MSFAPLDEVAEPGWIAVLVLAVVQGATEFLPVSSSGHLALGSILLGIEEAGLTLAIALHVGTLLAVLSVYGKDLWEVLRQVLRGDMRYALAIVVGTIPAGLVGVLLKDVLKQAFSNPVVAGTGLIITSIVLLLGEAARRRQVRVSQPVSADAPDLTKAFEAPGVLDALIIGSAQAMAITPGISRSGSTIAAGLMRGMDPVQASRFSFLLSVPAIAGAAVLDLPDALEASDGAFTAAQLFAGGAVAAAVGFVALRWLLAILSKGAFRVFALYCALLGGVVLVLAAR